MTVSTLRNLTEEELASIQEIKQLKAKYCHYLDIKDWSQWASLFTSDARFDESAWPVARHPVTHDRIPVPWYSFEYLEGLTSRFEWPIVGRQAIETYGEALAENITVNHVFNPTLELTSEATAKAVWPSNSLVWWPEGSPIRYVHRCGHFRETYERLDDERWYIGTLDYTPTYVEYR
jgi:hypothetical protein